jgi:MarR family transcriptional regulator for hemolysin
VEVVTFLLNNPDMDTARHMVDYRLIAKSHVSKAVDKLISEGFLTRQSDEADRRCIHLTLTEKAAPLAEEIQTRQKEFSARLKEGVTDREMAYLYEIADRIVANAEKMI